VISQSFSRFLLGDWTRFFLADIIMSRLSRRRRAWRREISPGQPYQPVAKLLAQHPGADFFDFTFSKFAELERPERDADEPCNA
jgi:hypothetical protein